MAGIGELSKGTDVDREYVDARLEAVRAQNDARFAEVLAVSRETAAEVRAIEGRLEGRMDALAGRMDGIAGRMDGIAHRLDATSTKGSVWGAAVTMSLGLFAAILTALALAANRFDAGVTTGRTVSEVSAIVDQGINARFDQLEAQIGRIVAAPTQVPPALPAPQNEPPVQ